MANSNPKQTATKRSEKPKRRNGPMFPHANGQWAKKILGRLHYFGKWDDRKTALDKYNAQHADLEAGRTPRPRGEEIIEVETACEVYLDFIEQRIEEGELEPQQYDQKYRTLEKFKIAVGKHNDIASLGPLDFQDANKALKTRQDGARASVSYHKDENHRVRTFFKWCLKAEIILQPPRYGAYFDPPGKRAIRLSQNDKVQKRFTRDEILRLLDAAEAANFRLYAAILLALNTGCQNVDIETLQMNDIDFKGRWYSQMRAKKGTKRKSRLWPRTVKALKRLAKQNGTGEGNSPIFKSKSGGTYSRKDCLSKEFATLRKECGITTKGAGFQWIRHTFFDTAKDRYWFAAKKSMGHEIQDVAATYAHDYDAILTEMSKYVEQRFF